MAGWPKQSNPVIFKPFESRDKHCTCTIINLNQKKGHKWGIIPAGTIFEVCIDTPSLARGANVQ